MEKKFVAVSATVLAICLASLLLYASYGNANGAAAQEQSCTQSGGTVVDSLCCKSSGDFPNSCAIGACGCSADNSHTVKTCQCPEGKCFDGSRCV